MNQLIPIDSLQNRILMIRGHRVMLDSDLAYLYGVTTKRLNQQVTRNLGRFPDDFMFVLTQSERKEVIANCNNLQRLKFSSALPRAFTEHGALMLASVLNTPIAVSSSIQVVRAFSKLRTFIAAHKELAKKLEQLEEKYDSQFRVVFDAIRELMSPKFAKPKKIGFRPT